MKYFHLNGPSGFYFRADSLASALALRSSFASSLGHWSGSSWAIVTITPSPSPINSR